MIGRLAAYCALAAALLFTPCVAQGASSDSVPPWPPDTVTFTLPFSKGSESDAFFALFKDQLPARAGKGFLVRNISGQAGADAWARMVDDPLDGSVVTAVVFPNIILRVYQPNSGVYPSQMEFCHIGAYAPCVLWTSRGANGFVSLDAFIDAARDAPNALLVAGPGRYSAGQTAARKLDRMAGVKTVYIPYAGSLEAAAAVHGGKARAFWGTSIPLSVRGEIFRPLGVAAEARLPSLPDVPTFKELGIDLFEGMFFGVAVPKDVSQYTKEDITIFFDACAGSPAYQAKAVEAGFAPLNLSGEAASAFFKEQWEAAQIAVEDYALTEQ